jgi:hypothetical protein
MRPGAEKGEIVKIPKNAKLNCQIKAFYIQKYQKHSFNKI